MAYKVVKYGKKAERRNYSRMRYDVELPYLIEIQTESFKKFIESDLADLLHDISPIEGLQGTKRLYFENPVVDYSKNLSTQECKKKDLTYSRTITVTARLVNADGSQALENEKIVLCELPMMTPTGTFIINGAERVIVSQIVRSAGCYFASQLDKKVNQIKYTGQMIPTRGAWIEFEAGAKDLFYAKVDRSKKIYLTTLLRAIGFKSDSQIKDFFGKELIIDTLVKDDKDTPDKAVVEVYSKLRGGESVPAAAAREFLRSRLFDNRRYDLAEVGRYKFNKKLDFTNRLLGQTLAQDILLSSGEHFEKGTIITKDILNLIKANRSDFRVEAISEEDTLQNQAINEVFAYRNPSLGDGLYVKTNISNIKTGEIILEENEEITPETIKKITENKNDLDENVTNYFLTGNIFNKSDSRAATMVEMIKILVKDATTGKNKVVNVIGNDQTETAIHVTVSDIIANVSYYLNLYEGIGSVDDIDHLGNRRLRLIGELLKNQFRIGLARTEKNIVDRMSTASGFDNLTIASIINTSPLSSALKTFFGSSQLSQFMDQTNPLSELTQKRRVSALGSGGLSRDRAGIDVRDVHNTHYGRICPIETPEGQSIGLISSLASYSKVDKFGFIQTPYLVFDRNGVKNGVVNPIITNEYKYLTADEEAEVVIASASTNLNPDGTIADEKVIGRLNGETSFFDPSDVSYMDVSPKQIVSVATATIPFLEHDDASRALMGANMQRQAVPLLKPESPIVGTGMEYKAAKDSGATVVCKKAGYVTFVDAEKIVITNKPTEKKEMSGKVLFDPKDKEYTFETAKTLSDYGLATEQIYELITFARSNQDTCVLQKPIVAYGAWVDEDEIIADGPSTDQGELALGRNVTVAFMTWKGYNYEDAVIMCEDLVKNDVYTSVHIDEYEVQTRDLRSTSSKEEITRDLPNVGSDALRQLDQDGIVMKGYEVHENDILVGKITPRGASEPDSQQKLLLSVGNTKMNEHKDTSLRVPHGEGGIVRDIQILHKKQDVLPVGVNESIKVFVAKKRKIREGDKMAGRHGNKGVISKILPREDMPYTEDGRPIDIMLNPLGVPSRMNIGQILEIALGYAAKKLGIKVATPVFDGVNDKELLEIMKEAGVSSDGKVTLYDGQTGLPYQNKISVGTMYMIKLSHMVDDKLHARAVGPYTLVTQQPMGGKAQNGGQRFGEMEVWALYAYGAAYILQEMLTVKSDDMMGRNLVYSAISSGKPIPKPSLPESFRVLTHELQALGLYVELINSETGENDAIKSIVTEKIKSKRRRV